MWEYAIYDLDIIYKISVLKERFSAKTGISNKLNVLTDAFLEAAALPISNPSRCHHIQNGNGK